jgi:hypothetical protein
VFQLPLWAARRGLGARIGVLTGVLEIPESASDFMRQMFRIESMLLSLLDMTGVCANRDVPHTEKAVLNHLRDFETIEVLLSHLQKYSL